MKPIKMKVLAGGPARETESDLFRLHREGLEAQRDDRFWVHITHEKVSPPKEGPRWTLHKIDRVARARQNFMDEASPSFRYDGLFMVDSDVIIGPGVLERMWRVAAPVVYGVFWTHWPGFSDELPQVWDTHPYGFAATDMLRRMILGKQEVAEYPVFGGGACTLIRGRGFDSDYHPLLDGLRHADGMWKGEDRTYCLGLEARRVPQVAVTGLPIVHLYDESQQTPAALAEARKLTGLGVV